MYWVGALLLLLVIFPVVVVLLRNVLIEANDLVPIVQRITAAAKAGSKDLDAAPLLLHTQQQAITTIATVAEYGGSLNTIIDDPEPAHAS